MKFVAPEACKIQQDNVSHLDNDRSFDIGNTTRLRPSFGPIVGGFLLALLLLMVAPSIIVAQEKEKRKGGDFAELRYLYSPPSSLRDSSVPDDYRIAAHGIRLTGTLPYFLEESKTIFINGITYSMLTAVLGNENKSTTDSFDFHMVQYTFSLVQILPNNLTVTAMLMPAIASDFEGFSFRDIRANSGVLVGYRFRKGFNIQGGVVYISNFGEDMILPMFGLQYKSEHWRIFTTLPAIFDVWYLPCDVFEMGFSTRIEGSQYHLHNTDSQVDFVKESSVNTGPIFRVYPYKGYFLQAWGGASVYRKMEAYRYNGLAKDFSPEPNWFVSAGLGYSF